jgi:hypothetical protein
MFSAGEKGKTRGQTHFFRIACSSGGTRDSPRVSALSIESSRDENGAVSAIPLLLAGFGVPNFFDVGKIARPARCEFRRDHIRLGNGAKWDRRIFSV